MENLIDASIVLIAIAHFLNYDPPTGQIIEVRDFFKFMGIKTFLGVEFLFALWCLMS